MKNLLSIIFVVFVIASCVNNKTNDKIKITGKVLRDSVDQVKLFLHKTDIAIEPMEYFAKVEDDSTFNFDIKSDIPLSGDIHIGGFYHKIFLMPGDDLRVLNEEDTIKYSGNGSARNTFLYEEYEKKGLLTYPNMQEIKKIIQQSEELYSNKLKLLNDSKSKYNLEPEFIKWFEAESSVIKNVPYLNALVLNRRTKALDEPNSNLKKELRDRLSVKNIVDDSKLCSREYLYFLNNYVYYLADEIVTRKSLKNNEALCIAIFDSLKGGSRDYTAAHLLKNYYKMGIIDEVVIEKFNEEITNPNAIAVVNKAHEKLKSKENLLNKPLNEEFKQTLLVDDKGNELTFEEMMSKHKGKVVYLDIWATWCGPCVRNMPASKKLKEKLSGEPIDFVYITIENYSDELWDRVYEKSFTKKNHYRFKKANDARMLKYLEISGVPNYMLFDKNTNLISYHAKRPTYPKIEEELRKYL